MRPESLIELIKTVDLDELEDIFCPHCRFIPEDLDSGPSCPKCGKIMVRKESLKNLKKILLESDQSSPLVDSTDRPPFKECNEIPWEISGGRYYHSMFFLPIPECPIHLLGGDTSGLLWRFDDEPYSWRLVYRMRYYNSTSLDDDTDEKSWYSLHINGRQYAPDQIIKMMESSVRAAQEVSYCVKPPEMEIVKIEGDSYKASEILTSGKLSWLHKVKTEKKHA